MGFAFYLFNKYCFFEAGIIFHLFATSFPNISVHTSIAADRIIFSPVVCGLLFLAVQYANKHEAFTA